MSRTTKPIYRKSRAIDASCRCGGSCDWCRGNRLHADEVKRLAAEEQIKEHEKPEE